ncbi:hypothetical protein HYQ45_016309 [Verticillium longisporum]|uniref:Uncharacterized protein n=1 Tax=Verticillium longisporum TaxID=100787 RepID=A0A8I3AGR0_VERLO|nr:hypothetical protein HYQ44_010489 [Verticillium longisporum]KAG7115380.1 hypothetical protein HYQ45_016309 [Verticillium longisporum]
MEPAIESILLTRPSLAAVSSTPIDIVACGSTLGNLLRFTSGDDKAFRMLVNVVGSIVHLIRREKSPKETIDDIRGYGHTFPDAYTTLNREARGSASHQRILSYCFGDKAAATRTGLASLAAEESTTVTSGHSRVEDLAASLSTAAISPAIPVDGPLTIKPAGRAIPQRAMFDLKTRSIKSMDVDHLAKELPRLYLCQTPNFIIAHHTSGVFKNVTIRDVRSRLSEWDAASAEPLGLLAVLLRRVLVLAHGWAARRAVLGL